MEQRTVAVEAAPDQVRLVDLTRAADGSLVAAYHAATAHVGARGRMRVLRSSDDGQTWTEPTTPIVREDDARDPKLATLSDGTLLLTWFELRWTGEGSKHDRTGAYAARSEDHGLTWGEPAPIGSRMVDEGGWIALHAPAVELPSGDVVQPLYGHPTQDDRDWVVTLARSGDGGRTFLATDEVVLGALPGVRLCEPNLSVLPDGTLAVLIRVDAPGHHAYLVRSDDDGRTWTEPELTAIPARSHHQLITSAGELLLTYGDPERANRPTVAMLVADPSGPWEGPVTEVYDSGHDDQANPSSVELSPGRFLTLGNDLPNHGLVAVTYHRDELG